MLIFVCVFEWGGGERPWPNIKYKKTQKHIAIDYMVEKYWVLCISTIIIQHRKISHEHKKYETIMDIYVGSGGWNQNEKIEIIFGKWIKLRKNLISKKMTSRGTSRKQRRREGGSASEFDDSAFVHVTHLLWLCLTGIWTIIFIIIIIIYLMLLF